MSLVIFFGMALCIFILGMIVITVTFYQWFKQAQARKQEKLVGKSPQTEQAPIDTAGGPTQHP